MESFVPSFISNFHIRITSLTQSSLTDLPFKWTRKSWGESMNLIFFSIIDLMKDFFNENFSSLENEIDANFLIDGWMVFQKSIEGFSGTEGDIPSAP